MIGLPDRIRRRIAVNADGCWIWAGQTNNRGYGMTSWNGNKTCAHRVVYQILVGPVPAGLELDHLCRVRHCVNPDHLEPVTHRVNVRRGGNTVKTHCQHGHPFTEENTYRWRGYRQCRTCRYHANVRAAMTSPRKDRPVPTADRADDLFRPRGEGAALLDHEPTNPSTFTGEARDRLLDGARRQRDELRNAERSPREPSSDEGVDAPPRVPAGEPPADLPTVPVEDDDAPVVNPGLPTPDVDDGRKDGEDDGDAA